MTKLQPIYHQGIEFVRLSSLPFLQYRKFTRWVSPLSIFRLEMRGDTLEDCVAYSEYEHWFEMNMRESYSESLYSF